MDARGKTKTSKKNPKKTRKRVSKKQNTVKRAA
jgi:hypothetical protein